MAKTSARKGMGFKAAARSVAARENLPVGRANAIIAAGARKASPAAKKANPNLKKVLPVVTASAPVHIARGHGNQSFGARMAALRAKKGK